MLTVSVSAPVTWIYLWIWESERRKWYQNISISCINQDPEHPHTVIAPSSLTPLYGLSQI